MATSHLSLMGRSCSLADAALKLSLHKHPFVEIACRCACTQGSPSLYRYTGRAGWRLSSCKRCPASEPAGRRPTALCLSGKGRSTVLCQMP